VDRTRPPEGALEARRDAPVGGQAVLEGVMMRGVSSWAVAVRDLRGELVVERFEHRSWASRRRITRLPVIRGVVALADSLGIGFKALGISANAQLPEHEKEISPGVWAGTVVVAMLFAVGLFFVFPVGVTSLFKDALGSAFAFWLAEGVLRTVVFLAYLWLLAKLPDMRRVFEYHGAEHKTISCYEAGLPLTPENAQRFTRLHPRCGTSFLLIVMVVAIFVFAPLGLPEWYLLIATRVLGVPLIAGLSFEVIKWAGRNRAKGWVRGLMWPGLQLQKLTTAEPDGEQLAVAIAALESVLEVEDPLAASDDDAVGMEVVA
jgi:uncharacterized protein YqhQ